MRASVPRPKIYDVLQSLDRYGLCTSTGSRVASWTAVSPDVALPELVRRRDLERKAQAGRDEELARLLVQSLPEPTTVAPAAESALIEALIGRARIAEEFEAMIERTERTLDIVQAMPIVQTPDRWNLVESSAIERGVEVRVLFTPEAAKDPRRYSSLLAAGGEGRLSNNLALKLVIRDGDEALVALRDPSFTNFDDHGMTSIRIMQPDLVGPLQTLFRRDGNAAFLSWTSPEDSTDKEMPNDDRVDPRGGFRELSEKTEGKQLRVLFCIGVQQTFFEEESTVGRVEGGRNHGGVRGSVRTLRCNSAWRQWTTSSWSASPRPWPWTAYVLADAPDLESVSAVCNIVRDTAVGEHRLWRYLRIEARDGRPPIFANH